jgi:hypothetical protein
LKSIHGKRSIVIVGTGLDTFSSHSYQDTIKQLMQDGVTVYAIDTGRLVADVAKAHRITSADISSGETHLRGITDLTGGRTWVPSTELDLSSAFRELAGSLSAETIVQADHSPPQCHELGEGVVQIDDTRPTGVGHCAGESDFWFTNTSAQAIDCAIIFHKNGRFDPTSVLTFTLSPGEKSGGAREDLCLRRGLARGAVSVFSPHGKRSREFLCSPGTLWELRANHKVGDHAVELYCGGGKPEPF